MLEVEGVRDLRGRERTGAGLRGADSRWTAASSSPSWARRAAASRRCSTSSPGSTRPTRARSCSPTRGHRQDRGRAGPHAPQAHRDRVPVLQPARGHDGARERGPPGDGRRAQAQAGRDPGRTCSTCSGCPTRPRRPRRRSPAASASGWPSPGRWPTSPTLLLADEPTGALDSEGGHEVIELFRRLHQGGQTILMVTHDDDVAAAAERIARMKDGKVIDAGDAPRRGPARTRLPPPPGRAAGRTSSTIRLISRRPSATSTVEPRDRHPHLHRPSCRHAGAAGALGCASPVGLGRVALAAVPASPDDLVAGRWVARRSWRCGAWPPSSWRCGRPPSPRGR